MKKILTALLALCLVLGGAVCAFATEPVETTAPEVDGIKKPGHCGDNITWTLENNVLTITGTGEMYDFLEGTPWTEHSATIQKVVISDGITYIGTYSFKFFDSLTEVEFGKDVREISTEAFFGCAQLKVIHLPAAFKIFGEASFQGCTGLEEIHCEGGFPSFRFNSMWDVNATIYFPAERPWGVEYIQQLEEAFGGRIEFIASDGTDPYEPAEPTEPTEAAQPPETTAPETVPPTTVPPTEMPTEPPAVTEMTEAATVPSATQDAVSTEPAETDAPTEATEPEEKEEEKHTNWIPLVILGAAGGFLVLGGLIFRVGNRGRYNRRRR